MRKNEGGRLLGHAIPYQNLPIYGLPRVSSSGAGRKGSGTVSPGCSGSNQSQIVVFNDDGAESSLRTCLDPLAVSAGLVQFPSTLALSMATANNTSTAALHDSLANVPDTVGETLSYAMGRFPIDASAPLWTVLRSGPIAAFTDTLDTGADIVAALGANAATGQLYHARVCNQTIYAETLATNTGISLTGALTVPQFGCRTLSITIVSMSGGTLNVVSDNAPRPKA